MPDSFDDKDLAAHSVDADEGGPELDQATQARLGKVLAQYCQDLVQQPVPAIFLSLLAKLEAQEREK